MNETDVEAIAHLDFEVEEIKAKPCRGWSCQDNDSGVINKPLGCEDKAEAVLVATRTCCGRKVSLCLNCYNAICRLHADNRDGILTHSKCGKKVIGKPYLPTVEWL